MVGIISGIFPADYADAFVNVEPLRSLNILQSYIPKGSRFFSTSLQTTDQSNVLGILIVSPNSLINDISLSDLPSHFMCNLGGRISFGLHPRSLYRFVIESHSVEVLKNNAYRIPIPPTVSFSGLISRVDPPMDQFRYNFYDTNTCIYTGASTILKSRYETCHSLSKLLTRSIILSVAF